METSRFRLCFLTAGQGVYHNPFDRGLVENIKELVYCRAREIYQRTASLPGSPFQPAAAQDTLLPTRVGISKSH